MQINKMKKIEEVKATINNINKSSKIINKTKDIVKILKMKHFYLISKKMNNNINKHNN